MAPDPERPEEEGTRRLCIVVRPSAREGELAAALRCLKRLVPSALLVVAPPFPAADDDAELVVVEAEEIAAGPFAAASALRRAREAAARGAPRDPSASRS